MKTLRTFVLACALLSVSQANIGMATDAGAATKSRASAYSSVVLTCATGPYAGQEEVRFRWLDDPAGQKVIEVTAKRFRIYGTNYLLPVLDANDVYIGLETYPVRPSAAGVISYGWKTATTSGISDAAWHDLNTSISGATKKGTGFARIYVKFTFDANLSADPSCQATQVVNAPG